MATRRYVKRTRPSTFRGRPVGPPLIQITRSINPRRSYGIGVIPGYTQTRGAYGRSLSIAGRRGVAEKKYQDVDIDSVGVAVAGTFLNTDNFVRIGQGTTKNTRLGNKINVCNFNIHGTVGLPASATQVGTVVRIIVGIDKQTNGAATAVTDVLEFAEYDSFRSMDSVDRFKILKDKWVTVNPNLLSAAGGDITRVFKFNFKNMNWPVHYSGTTGAITEIRSNSVFVLCIASTAQAVIDAQTRIKFYDL